MFPGASNPDVSSLTNQFLIAMPGMLDEQFAGSVVYLFEHNAKGAMGLVVNRPTDVSLSTLLDKIELKLEITPFADQAVYFAKGHGRNQVCSYEQLVARGLLQTDNKVGGVELF